MTSRELLEIVRGFDGLNLVGADIVEVSPAYDHAEITGVAAANLAYEFASLLRGANGHDRCGGAGAVAATERRPRRRSPSTSTPSPRCSASR